MIDKECSVGNINVGSLITTSHPELFHMGLFCQLQPHTFSVYPDLCMHFVPWFCLSPHLLVFHGSFETTFASMFFWNHWNPPPNPEQAEHAEKPLLKWLLIFPLLKGSRQQRNYMPPHSYAASKVLHVLVWYCVGDTELRPQRPRFKSLPSLETLIDLGSILLLQCNLLHRVVDRIQQRVG